MSRTRLAPLSLLFVLVLIGAGCGDDGGSVSSSSESQTDEEAISEDDWIDEASQLCTDWAEASLDADSGASDVEVAASAIEVNTEFRDELEDLGPPEDIGDEADELIELVDDRIGIYEETGEAAANGDDLADLIEEATQNGEDITQLVNDLGLDCGFDSPDFSSDLSSDFSDDFSTDFSSDFSSDFNDDLSLGSPVPPDAFIPDFGSSEQFDDLAVSCFEGDLAACDTLYSTTPVSDSVNSYEGYGNTCGGRLAAEYEGDCTELG